MTPCLIVTLSPLCFYHTLAFCPLPYPFASLFSSQLRRKFERKQTAIFGEDVYKNTQHEVEQESNKRVSKVFHIARERETHNRLRQSSIRAMLVTIKEDEKKEHEGENGGMAVEAKVVQGTNTRSSSGSTLGVGGGTNGGGGGGGGGGGSSDGLLLDVEQGSPHGTISGLGGPTSNRPTPVRSRRQSLDSVLEDVVWDEHEGDDNHVHIIHDNSNSSMTSDNTSFTKNNSNHQFSLWDNPEHHEYNASHHHHTMGHCNDSPVPFTSRGVPESDFIDFPRLSLSFER